ncbi:MAG: SDR family NAD(P)-dependent oxidoreductase [Candidatus Kapabacteria bacterium]|jgi:NAD(P)-dependent dehydrogenase (short-subunit alcohol dehydrogenase family)|nr:SDR family NAD(P)-dependent oxidoreductase [Candidatus Kapabacteria bacterium]
MKTAIISGASGALGKAVCERFLEGEWRVYALAKRAESAKALSADLAKYARRLNVVVCDLASTVSTQHFLTASGLEQCDAVIHCAGGIQAGKPIEETSPEIVHAMLEINYLTAFNLLRATLPLLKTSGGAVLTIAAKSALSPEKNKSAYAASKAALIALTQATAHENKAFNVRANCIVPSIIDTPTNREWGAPKDLSKWTSPQSIAEAAWMLCSEAGAGISGAVIPMTGKM